MNRPLRSMTDIGVVTRSVSTTMISSSCFFAPAGAGGECRQVRSSRYRFLSGASFWSLRVTWSSGAASGLCKYGPADKTHQASANKTFFISTTSGHRVKLQHSAAWAGGIVRSEEISGNEARGGHNAADRLRAAVRPGACSAEQGKHATISKAAAAVRRNRRTPLLLPYELSRHNNITPLVNEL